MAKGGGSILVILAGFFFLAFSFLAVLRITVGLIWFDENLSSIAEQVWQVVLQIGLAGMARDTQTHALNKVVGFVTVIAGMVIFSSLVAFITGLFNAKIRELRKGKSVVLEEGHTLILGFGEPLLDIILELIIANESEDHPVLVILSEKPKEEMDDFLQEKVKNFQNTHLVTRTGNTTNLQALQRAGVTTAKTVIILNSAHIAGNLEEQNIGDSRVLKALMALVSLVGEENMIPVVAQIYSATNRRLAENLVPGTIQTLDSNDILSRILVQTTISTGLASVYSDMVGFEGNEIYFYHLPQGWLGHSYGKLQFHFIQSALLGFRKQNGSVVLNPHPDYIPGDEEAGIFLAEDDSSIHFYHHQVVSVQEPKFFIKKTVLSVENLMVVGWNNKILSLIDEFAKYTVDRSIIHIVVESLNEEIQQATKELQVQYPYLLIEVMEVDLHNPSNLVDLAPHTYNSVIFLAEDKKNSEEVDANTISRLLEFRNFFRKLEQENGISVTTKLVTEVMDFENAELIVETGARDFIIPHQFISKIFAQLSQELEVKKIYDELFKIEGCCIYVKPVNLFFERLPVTISFANCMKVAQMRRETCFGVRLNEEWDDKEQHYGIHLLPYKSEVFELNEGDGLVTLANQRT
ncbi:MAG: hypothetical protein HQM14_02585 [SAR324 cluster bacterium]|nr:hypothetical protein [SAR324 cluster bacterium]